MATASRARKSFNAKASETEASLMARAEQLRADLAQLADSIGAAGSDKASGLGAETAKRIESLRGASDEMISELSEQLSGLEKQVAGTVRERPLQSLGVAVAAGFLVALMLRR